MSKAHKMHMKFREKVMSREKGKVDRLMGKDKPKEATAAPEDKKPAATEEKPRDGRHLLGEGGRPATAAEREERRKKMKQTLLGE